MTLDGPDATLAGMKLRLKHLLLASTLTASALSLSGCVALTIAGIAADVVTTAIGGSGQPGAEASPGEQIQQALSTVDDQVSPSCSARLAQMNAGPPQAGETARPQTPRDAGGDAWGRAGWRFDGADDSPKPADMPLSASRPLAGDLRGPVPPELVAAPAQGEAAASPGPVAPASAPQLAVARQERIEGKRCSVRPTCLPGMQSPVPMMVCERADPAQADGAQADGAQADGTQAGGAQVDGAQVEETRAGETRAGTRPGTRPGTRTADPQNAALPRRE